VEPLFTGYDVDSGYAEYMTAPEDFIYPMPKGVSSRESAPFLRAGIIGYRALRRRNLQKGETWVSMDSEPRRISSSSSN
jgi:propanol-preferring alcohol dehydrogenase